MLSKQLSELLKKTNKVIFENYEGVLGNDFNLENKLAGITLEVEAKINVLARIIPQNIIQLKELRGSNEDILLVLHEIMHVIFTVENIRNYQKGIIEKEKKWIKDNFLQKLLDSFIDLQIKIFTNFEKETWIKLQKSTEPPYFNDGAIRSKFVNYINEKNISKKLINLDECILSFIQDNVKLILDNQGYNILLRT